MPWVDSCPIHCGVVNPKIDRSGGHQLVVDSIATVASSAIGSPHWGICTYNAFDYSFQVNMLLEVKTRINRIVDSKSIRSVETYVLDKDFFSDAEMIVTAELGDEVRNTEGSFEILSIRQSPIKEIADQFQGDKSFIVTLKDIFHDDNGKEKSLRYKVLLYADSPSDAMRNASQLQRQGYDMQIEGLREVNYIYINNQG